MSDQADNHVDFLTVREEVNEYKLKDNSTIKMKVSLIDLRKKDTEGQFTFCPQAIFSKTESPDDMKKADEPEPIDEIAQKMEYQPIIEPINIYDIPGKFILLVKPLLSSVLKSNKYDSNGKRIYAFKIDCMVSVVAYPEFASKPIVEPITYTKKETYSSKSK